jgi:hypothetical protein
MSRPAVMLVALALGALGAAHAIANPPTKASRQGFHGAIAYDAASGAHGFSYDFQGSRQAKEAALAQCGKPECVVLVSFKNSCAALAQGAKRSFTSQGATRAEAETRAMARCDDKKACKLVAWSCTK